MPRASRHLTPALAALLFVPLAARAGDATLAEALFRDGKALMNAGDYAHACPKLAESYKQDPATGTLFALAVCYEQRGSLASAWSTYSQVAARAHQEARADREQAARERVNALTPQLSRLSVQVPAEVAALPGLVVRRDDQPLGEAAWGTALPADGGKHTVEVSASGKKTWRAVVELGREHDARTITVPALAEDLGGPRESSGDTASNGTARSGTASALRPIGLVVGGLGLVGVGVGAAFGLKAKSNDESSKADGHCDETGCDATGKAAREDAFSAARVSTALFVAGAVLVVGGGTLYLMGAPKRASVAITGSASPKSADLLLEGHF
jgi:hypothetical protein